MPKECYIQVYQIDDAIRGGGLAQEGLPLPLGRAQNLQIRTNFRASYCPACAKPLVSCNRTRHSRKESTLKMELIFIRERIFPFKLWQKDGSVGKPVD